MLTKLNSLYSMSTSFEALHDTNTYTSLRFLCDRETTFLILKKSHKEPDAVDHRTLPSILPLYY